MLDSLKVCLTLADGTNIGSLFVNERKSLKLFWEFKAFFVSAFIF